MKLEVCSLSDISSKGLKRFFYCMKVSIDVVFSE